MSTLKPMRKPPARANQRRSAAKTAASNGSSPTRLIAAALVVAVVVVVGILIARSRTNAPIVASGVPVDQAVRPLNAPTGQTAEGYWYKGNADAPVTVTVFGDFQCPSCAAAYQRIEGGIDTTFIETGKVKFIYHDFPLPMHPNAIPAAQAARAAGEQGKFWAMHDLLYARQAEWAEDRDVTKRLKGYAADLGLDQQAFDKALDDKQYAGVISAAAADGTKQGINATPTYQVDGKIVDTNGLAAAIDAALKAKGR
ncbi:MAG TPA: thioredoxin domain-containing protein [Thermomicrobiales bacterium]|jgi:protein-disulfide isomerase